MAKLLLLAPTLALTLALTITTSLLLSPATQAAHSPDEEADLIRQARLKEILDRSTYSDDPEIFRESILQRDVLATTGCKYISSISTPPPAMRVALTFDDGPDASGTPYVIAVLEKYRVPATFFLQGESAAHRRDLLDRLAGTEQVNIANHSWNHPNFHGLSATAQAQQLISTDDLLGTLQAPKFFRYPYGNSTCPTNTLAHSRNYQIVGWHVDSCDWGFNRTGSVSPKDARICGVSAQHVHNFRGHVVAQLKNRRGGILLMHDVQPNTIQQLDLLIEELIREGFTFGKLDEPGFQPSMR